MEEQKNTKEIDVIGLIKKVFSEKKLLTISIIAGAIVGVIIALSTPKTYTSEVLLAPEIASGGLGLSSNLADMASSFGIDLSSSGKTMDAIYPEIYPEVLSSKDFVYSLFNIPVRLKDDDNTRTYLTHITKELKFPFWDYPKMWIAKLLKPDPDKGKGGGGKDPFKLSKVEDDICRAISSNIECLVDNKTSVILISVTDQDPLVAAIVADTVQNRLQNYITSYRTKKARTDYQYYSDLYDEAKKEYEKAQSKYAGFSDANQDVVLESYAAKRDELENEMQLAFNLMNQMSTQMQTAKAKIQERTPAYTIIETPKMPYKASSTPRFIIVLVTMLFFAAMASFWILFLRDIIKRK